MQKKTLYIHIGQPKTATTSIQSFLGLNRELLLNKYDLYFPQAEEGNDRHEIEFLFAHYRYDPSIKEQKKKASKMRKKLLETVQQSPAARVLLSAELLYYSRKNMGKIKKVFADYNVKIILYLRRIDHHINSWYKNKFKENRWGFWQDGAQAFYDYYQINYVKRRSNLMNELVTQFGQDNIMIRPYEKEQNQPNIFADFLSLLDIELTKDFVLPKRKNSSFSNEVIELIRKIQCINKKHILRQTILGKFIGTLLRMHPITHKEPSIYSPQQRIELLNACEKSDRQIAQEFLGQDKLFYEPWPDPNEDWQKPKYKHPKNLFLLYCKLFSKSLFGQ